VNAIADATASGKVTLLNHLDDGDYRAARVFAERPLRSGDLTDLLPKAKAAVEKRRLLLPDSDVLLERAVTALLTGHLILEGPPGTGKSTLAAVLAEAFGCGHTVETATADWSTYDVIGGLQPAPGGSEPEVLKPWLGHVPRAAIRCADAIAQNEDDPAAEPDQAHWLVIDEFNRADIDKAIGPLYTVLGGGGSDERRRLPLWFGDSAETRECWIPDRFRIVGTLNSVDTAYVFTLSQGLQRRFQFVHVGVPAETQLADEMTNAVQQALEWRVISYGSELADADRERWVSRVATSDAMKEATNLLADLVGFLRYDEDVKWPVGTAQVVDVLRAVALAFATTGEPSDLNRSLDLALSDRLIPQMSSLLRSQLDSFEEKLVDDFPDFQHILSALRHLRRAQQTSFA
jgi:5-methylcytosine-specific restriction enzyme B